MPPKSIKTDNANAFKSSTLKSFLENFKIAHVYSTLYVNTPIGTVERKVQSLENHIKTYLIEDIHFRLEVKRTSKLLRYTVSKSTGITPFEEHHGRKPRNLLTNVFDLEKRVVASSKISTTWTAIFWRKTLNKQTTSLGKCLTASTGRVRVTPTSSVNR